MARAGVAIPMPARDAAASALSPSCQAGQQREWSHAWPVNSMPKGRIGSWARSEHPQARHRPGGERTGWRLSHSTRQQAAARVRPRPGAGRHRVRRYQPARRRRSASPWLPDHHLPGAAAPRCRPCDAKPDEEGGGGCAGASSTRSLPSIANRMPAERAAFRASAAFIGVYPSLTPFPWSVFLRPHRPQRLRHRIKPTRSIG